MTRMRARLFMLQVLVLSLLAVLAVRLWQVQVVRGRSWYRPRRRPGRGTWSCRPYAGRSSTRRAAAGAQPDRAGGLDRQDAG